jgi:hypothetical protein
VPRVRYRGSPCDPSRGWRRSRYTLTPAACPSFCAVAPENPEIWEDNDAMGFGSFGTSCPHHRGTWRRAFARTATLIHTRSTA